MRIAKLINVTARFVWALIKHISDGFKKVSKLVYNNRLSVCLRCEYLDKTTRPWEHCNICSCPVRKKASWKSESCPKDKWI